jgi:hypothetical protein
MAEIFADLLLFTESLQYYRTHVIFANLLKNLKGLHK